jgi:hypothetical protein
MAMSVQYGDEVYVVELTALRCTFETHDLIPIRGEPEATFRERAEHWAMTFKRLEPTSTITLKFKRVDNRTVHAVIAIDRQERATTNN